MSMFIYSTMDSVFATIWMALRGSTMSLSLSRLRTQSGANLKENKKLLVISGNIQAHFQYIM